MQLVFLGLALFCFLDTGVDSVPVQPAGPEAQPTVTTLPTDATPVVPTDATVTADDDTNSTVAVLQVTDYHYLDWPQIGYQIFMQKMLDALQTLKFYMSLEPMILKITRTYILTNATDLDYDDNNNSTDINSNEVTSTQSDESIETNTESPLVVEISGNSEDNNTNTPSFKDDSKETHAEDTKHDDVKKTKTESGGFFSTITGAVADFYHTLTGWF